MKNDNIRYITLPESFKVELGSFSPDPSIPLPVLIPEGKKEAEMSDYTVENLMAGMISVVAHETKNPNFSYYKKFVLAADPSIVDKLNQAAIAKEQRKEFEFAEELFLAVYHLLPQNASCVNLATLYSYLAVEARNNGGDEKKWIGKVRSTLEDGIDRFGEDEMILSELASFEAYMGNLEEAKEYGDRYLEVAEESERKKEIRKMIKEINFKIENSDAITEAYDFITLGEPDKALPIIESFLSKNPAMWNGHFLKGWALRVRKNYSEAKECFLECMKLGEVNSEIYNELSICELEEGNRELAKAYLETAIDLDEENLTTTTNLAYLHLEDGEYDSAREYLEKARYLAKDDKLVKSLIKEYEKATGDKIGAVIHEEYVKNTEDPSGEEYEGSSFERDFEAFRRKMEEDFPADDEGCSCISDCSCGQECSCGDSGCSCGCGDKCGDQ
ncbi:MAG: tetratricopeptide repeat protein [Candidatus Ornithospirochaeta sp.]